MTLTHYRPTILLLLLTASLSTTAFAQATRTWVSGVGDDANPCSRTAPCKTFAGAIGKTAASGEINVIDPGGFGAVTITKSMTINGMPSLAGILITGGNGVNINSSAGGPINVTLRGLEFEGLPTSGHGINVIGGGVVTLHVENVQFFGFAGNGINIAPNAAANVTVSNSRISDCTGIASSGINADATGGAVNLTVINSEVHNCLTGLNIEGGAKVNARLSDFSQNTTGVALTDATSTALLDTGTIAFCTAGINVATSGGIVRFSNMTIIDNTTGISTIAGGALVSFGNNRIKGNGTDGLPTKTVFQN